MPDASVHVHSAINKGWSVQAPVARASATDLSVLEPVGLEVDGLPPLVTGKQLRPGRRPAQAIEARHPEPGQSAVGAGLSHPFDATANIRRWSGRKAFGFGMRCKV